MSFSLARIAERELQRFIQAGFHGFARHMQAMIRDADVTDLALRFRFQHRLIKACAVAGLQGRRSGVWNW